MINDEIMGWLGLTIWAAVTVLMAVMSSKTAYRLAASSASRNEKWKLLRKQIKKVGMVGTGLCGIVIAISGFSLLTSGFMLIALTAIQQPVFAIGLHVPFNAIRGDNWPLKSFVFRMLISVWSVCLPIGLTLMLAGGILQFSRDQNSIENLVLLACLAFLWVTQWSVLRALTLPGKLVEFPIKHWAEEAQLLSEKVGTKLNDLLLVRSGKARVAGAYALGNGRIAITDYLLSALSEDEFLAIMAHELQHFNQRKQSLVLISKLILIGILIGSSLAFLSKSANVNPIFCTPFALLYSVWSIARIKKLKQMHEDDADDASIREIGGMSLMRALTKTYALNGRLGDTQRGTVHRALNDRLSRIAELSKLEPQSVQLAVEDARLLTIEPGQVSLQGA